MKCYTSEEFSHGLSNMRTKLLVNPSSGNHYGRYLLTKNYGIDSAATQPEKIKQQLIDFAQPGDTLIIAGGDGSLHLVFNGLYQSQLIDKVRVVLFPLGTGNDLANALQISKRTMPQLLAAIKPTAATTALPLWSFNQTVFSNYLSWGIDAKTVHDVDRWRKKLPHSRFINKLLYSISALRNFTTLRRKNFTLNGEIEKLYALVIVNINSYAAGCNLVNSDINSDKHFYVIRVKSRRAYVRLLLKRFFPSIDLNPTAYNQLTIKTNCHWLQVDGEAHQQTEGCINFANTVNIMC